MSPLVRLHFFSFTVSCLTSWLARFSFLLLFLDRCPFFCCPSVQNVCHVRMDTGDVLADIMTRILAYLYFLTCSDRGEGFKNQWRRVYHHHPGPGLFLPLVHQGRSKLAGVYHSFAFSFSRSSSFAFDYFDFSAARSFFSFSYVPLVTSDSSVGGEPATTRRR